MINLRLYDRNGTTLLGLLPEPISWSMSAEFSEVGALTFEYPTTGLNAGLIAELREVALVDAEGDEYVNSRFVITGIDRDRIATTGTIGVTARSILWRLDTALAYPEGGIASGEVARYFDNQTAGSILKTLIDSAQARGALAGLTYDFGVSADSNAQAWGLSTTQEYPARSTILSVIRGLADLGLVEVETIGRNLSATKADGTGTDKTTGNNPIVLRYGYNLTEAPESTDGSVIAGAVLVEAEGGLLVERTNATTLSTYGRLETALTASGIDDTATVNAVGDTYLGTLADADRQLTVGLTLQDGAPAPLVDFIPGDYVYTQTNTGLERVRVRQITLSMSGGVLTASATLGDRLYENDIRVARRIAAITSGSVQAGNGTLLAPNVTVAADTIAPSNPTSLTGTTDGYVEGIDPRASVSLTWTAPTTNSNGSALTDLAYYEVQKRTGAGASWEFVGNAYTNSLKVGSLPVNTSLRFQVFAIDQSGNRSTASNEFTITTANLVATEVTPSAPTLSSRLGTISIVWDGLGASGQAMSSTFSYLAVHVSTTSGFTPSAGTFEARMTGADNLVLSDLAYSTTYYVKFVAYNKAGIPSTASAQASASIQPLVNSDIIANTISGAKIENGTITASDKIVANTITGGLIQALAITSDKIAANAITANKIEAGAIDGQVITGANIRTSGATARVELTSAGFKAYNSSGTATVSINTDGSATFTGAINGTSGYLGSAANGWNFSSNGVLQNSGGTTILYPTTAAGGNANTYALYTDRSVYVNKVFAADSTSTALYSSGGVFATTNLTAGNFNFTVNSSGVITACAGLTVTGTGSISGTVSTGALTASSVTSSGSSSLTTLSIPSTISITGGYGVTSDWSPNVDGTRSVGQATQRWVRFYANNSTISTSDARLKTAVTETELGLDFIKSLRPVSYKWIVGDTSYKLDEEGNPIETGVDELGKPIFELETRPGIRRHYGFIAQEVKQALDASGVEDFAGWVQDDLSNPDSRQSLSYEQFIAPLTKAVQELAARLEQLEARA